MKKPALLRDFQWRSRASPHSEFYGLSARDIIWTLGSVSVLHRQAFDPELLARDLPAPPLFKVKRRRMNRERLTSLPLPCVVLLEESVEPTLASQPTSEQKAPIRPSLLVRLNDTHAMIFKAGTNQPLTITGEEFGKAFTGCVLQFAPMEEALKDPDAARSSQRPFGFRWFLPELLKHKRVWRDVVITARLRGVENIREFIASAAVTLVLDLPFLFIFIAIMFAYNVPLTVMALGLISAIVVVSLIVAPIFRSRLNDQFLLGARNQAFATEYIAGLESDYLADYLRSGFIVRRIANSYNVLANGLEQAMGLLILVVGATFVMGGGDSFTIGMLVAFQMFASRVSQPMLRLVGLWQQFQQASLSWHA